MLYSLQPEVLQWLEEMLEGHTEGRHQENKYWHQHLGGALISSNTATEQLGEGAKLLGTCSFKKKKPGGGDGTFCLRYYAPE